MKGIVDVLSGFAGLTTSRREECIAEVRHLVIAGANINECNRLGETPIIISARCGSPKLLQLLLVESNLGSDADINAQDHELGFTALHWASYNGDLEIVRMLTDAGANVNLRTDTGETPLLLAEHYRRYEPIVQHLAKCEALLHMQDNFVIDTARSVVSLEAQREMEQIPTEVA